MGFISTALQGTPRQVPRYLVASARASAQPFAAALAASSFLFASPLYGLSVVVTAPHAGLGWPCY